MASDPKAHAAAILHTQSFQRKSPFIFASEHQKPGLSCPVTATLPFFFFNSHQAKEGKTCLQYPSGLRETTGL